MIVKLGDCKSTPRQVHGGSPQPQGSILGNYLFCLSTDDLEGEVNSVLHELVKFIDDFNYIEELDPQSAIISLSSQKAESMYHAAASQRLYETVQENAAKIGMKVNPLKTKLLCISNEDGYNTRAYIRAGYTRIESSDQLRILGYHIDSRANPEAHIRHLESSVHPKMWVLRNLKKAKATAADQKLAYTSMIRSVIEYMSPVYHSLLTKAQSDRIEKLQERALRTIVGWDKTYQQALHLTNLQPLYERREEALKKFATSVEKSERFTRKWLIPNENRTSARNTQKYKEEICRTQKFSSSPVNQITRILNKIDRDI